MAVALRRWAGKLALAAVLLALVGAAATYVIYTRVSEHLDEAMNGRVWDLPSRLYPVPLQLRVGARIPPGPLEKTLEAMGYQKSNPVQQPGQYRVAAEGRYFIRPLPAWNGAQVASSAGGAQARPARRRDAHERGGGMGCGGGGGPAPYTSGTTRARLVLWSPRFKRRRIA